MKKRILGLFLVICLAMSLLPVVAMADEAAASVTVGGKTLKIKGYDAPAYSVNTPMEVLDTGDNKFTAIGQAVTTDAENWNAKFVWNTGDTAPTLYLKGFKFDDYNAESGKWKARYQADREDPDKKDAATNGTGISVPAGQPLNIVITGEDSLIQTRFGITYKSNLNIKSEGEAKLTIHNLSSAITSDTTKGCALTVDANLDLWVKSLYNTANSHILQTYEADLTINGGNIKVDTESNGQGIFGITARGSGNIIINGGNITATSAVGTAPTNGTIHSLDQIIVNGGTLNLTAKQAVPMYAKKGIIINGGYVNIFGPYYGINAGTKDNPADVEINGGTLEITAERAFYNYPKLGPNVKAYAGANKENCEVYDGTSTNLAKQPWMIISSEKLDIVVTEPTLEGGERPYVPTEPATTATSPSAPSTAATTPTENTQNTDSGSNDTILWIVIAAVVVVAGAAVVLIVVKRKKA